MNITKDPAEIAKIQAANNERLALSCKDILTAADKIRLKELNEFLEKNQAFRHSPYYYQGWMVHHYNDGSERFIACQEARVLRAFTKDGIEKAVRDENFLDYYKNVEDEDV